MTAEYRKLGSDPFLRGALKRAELRMTALDRMTNYLFKGIHSQDSPFKKSWDSLDVIIFLSLPEAFRLNHMKLLVCYGY